MHATYLLDGGNFEGAEAPALINVAHGLHQGTDNDLGVVLEEVDLRTQIDGHSKGVPRTLPCHCTFGVTYLDGAVGEVEDNG